MGLMFLSTLFFGVMGAVVKALSFDLPVEIIAFGRFFFGLLMILGLVGTKAVKLEFNNKKVLVFRGIFGGIAILLFFKSIELIPLSVATVLSFTYPFFATIFGVVYLKEKIHTNSMVAFVLSFIGVVLIVNPLSLKFNPGYLLAMFSAVFSGLAVVTIRRLETTENAWTIIFALMVVGTLFSATASFNHFVMPDLSSLSILLAAAAFATFGQLLAAMAFKKCRASEGSIMSMFTVVIATLFSYFLFKEPITLNFILGGSMILMGTYFLLRPFPIKAA